MLRRPGLPASRSSSQGWSSRRAGLLDLRDALTLLPHPRDGAELVHTGGLPASAGTRSTADSCWQRWAGSCVAGSPAALALSVVLLVFFRLKSGREEAWLRQRYPGYEAYARRTRRMIPFLY